MSIFEYLQYLDWTLPPFFHPGMWTEDFLANILQVKKLGKHNIEYLCYLAYISLAFQLENQSPNDIKPVIISAKEDIYFCIKYMGP